MNYQSMDPTLSSRESDVIKLVALGLYNKEIAKELVISIHTVQAHLDNIRAKWSVGNRTELAVLAITRGYIEPWQAEAGIMKRKREQV